MKESWCAYFTKNLQISDTASLVHYSWIGQESVYGNQQRHVLTKTTYELDELSVKHHIAETKVIISTYEMAINQWKNWID